MTHRYYCVFCEWLFTFIVIFQTVSRQDKTFFIQSMDKTRLIFEGVHHILSVITSSVYVIYKQLLLDKYSIGLLLDKDHLEATTTWNSLQWLCVNDTKHN